MLKNHKEISMNSQSRHSRPNMCAFPYSTTKIISVFQLFSRFLFPTNITPFQSTAEPASALQLLPPPLPTRPGSNYRGTFAERLQRTSSVAAAGSWSRKASDGFCTLGQRKFKRSNQKQTTWVLIYSRVPKAVVVEFGNLLITKQWLLRVMALRPAAPC